MENYLSVLNEKQLEAVTTSSQYVRIIAGAGSGKTRVLTTRIVYIIKEWGIDPRKILAITFTNKATNEMRFRINEQLPEESGKIHISTIHSYCVTILRQDIRHLGYPSNFTILDVDDQKSILKEAYKYLDIDSKKYTPASMLDYIANMKYALYSGDEAIAGARTPYEKKKAEIYDFYLKRQGELYALDFDDLLLWTVKLLKTHSDVREKWQRRSQYILVDEFQDIDNTQYEMIQLLTTENTSLYVVGDPDQTIYTWRGANINIIMHFETDFRPCETIVLERNYRSSRNILGAANSLIKFNRNRVKKDLFTENEDGELVIHYKALNEIEEANFVVSTILDLNRQGYDYDDTAILYRSNYVSRAFEKALMDMKLPYVIYGAVRFYERMEIKDALSYLRMLTAADDLSFKRIINVPKRGIGNKTVDAILDYARENRMTMYEAAKVLRFPTKTQKNIDELIQNIEKWKEASAGMKLEEILQMVLEESGYKAMLETSEDFKDVDRLENLKELINDMYDYTQINPESGLDEYLQMVALYTDIQSDKEGKFVSLMTVHAAKGLEFKNVFVVGLSDGIFPSAKSLEDGIKGLEEERRLAYVAFTRAKENLYLTESGGYSYATSTAKESSRFLDEVDETFVQPKGKLLEKEPSYNPSMFNTEYVAPSRRPKSNLKPGDRVVHDDFGEGVVISVNGNFGDIAFEYPYLVRTLSLNFPKLHKKEKKDE